MSWGRARHHGLHFEQYATNEVSEFLNPFPYVWGMGTCSYCAGVLSDDANRCAGCGAPREFAPQSFAAVAIEDKPEKIPKWVWIGAIGLFGAPVLLPLMMLSLFMIIALGQLFFIPIVVTGMIVFFYRQHRKQNRRQ